MKKIVLSFLFITAFAFFASAQITKGSVLLGGGVSFGQSKSESTVSGSYKGTGFSISPNLGFAIKENQVFGFFVSYTHRNNKPESLQSTEFKNNGYGTGVFYRKYAPLSKSFYLFGEANTGYYRNKTVTKYIDSEMQSTNNNVRLNLYPGIAYVVNNRIHLEAGLNNLISLGYTNNKSSTTFSSGAELNSEDSGFDFTTNLNTNAPLTIGFRIVLAK